MPTPCSSCRRSSRSCIVDIPSGFCSECLARGTKCDLVVTQKDWDKLDALKAKLRSELDAAERAEDETARLREEAVLEAMPIRAARAHSRRLRRKLLLLERKEAEMSRRELGSIEELEALEREAEKQQASLSAPVSPSAVSLSGWSDLDFSVLEGLEFPGFVGETAQVSDRSSSNA
ncbi:hypothetical protein M501DRAFT_1004142 [Patellaria atrata CBS 101060]|uniref:Zn(2)-C6 fungal-type domain-containing protein n=1 Tax=Patellaria atrata CBS 101060 TaxID=1346257 RepID=A0A9P4VLE8_9PEZI|nr:hypothetical protein M501DRAFT_1004142 [Patellaria atrata CBS 101060]